MENTVVPMDTHWDMATRCIIDGMYQEFGEECRRKLLLRYYNNAEDFLF